MKAMKPQIPARAAWLAAGCALILALAGCINLEPNPDPLRLFVLQSQSLPADLLTRDPPIDVEVERVELPGYLDDRRMVIRKSPTELEMREFDRWSETLETGISRVVAENLAGLPAIREVSRYPWSNPVSEGFYRLRLKIFQFEARADGTVEFDGLVILLPPEKGARRMVERVVLTTPSQGTDSSQVAATLSATLRELSARIAGFLAAAPATPRP